MKIGDSYPIVAYLCGHLHTFFDLMPRIYVRRDGGLLELELADFKDNRRFRVMTFDHDLFSLSDVKFGQWPVVVITNPKSASLLSAREPFGRIGRSTHIRFLAFSPSAIESFQVSIDGKLIDSQQSLNSTESFYSVEWQPNEFASGLHEICVSVKDSSDRSTNQCHSFSIDGTTGALDVMPHVMLTSNVDFVLKGTYFTVHFAVLIVFYLLWKRKRSETYKKQDDLIDRQTSAVAVPFGDKHIWKFVLFAWIAMMFLPWFVGQLSPDTIGVYFLWGLLFADGQSFEFVTTMDTFLFANREQFYRFLPFVIHCWVFGEWRWTKPNKSIRFWWLIWLRDILSAFVFAFSSYYVIQRQIRFVLFIYKQFGIWSVLLSPLGSWYSLLNCFFVVRLFLSKFYQLFV